MPRLFGCVFGQFSLYVASAVHYADHGYCAGPFVWYAGD